MLGPILRNFIMEMECLQRRGKLLPNDQLFLEQFQAKYSIEEATDISWLYDQFRARWAWLKDTPNDFTYRSFEYHEPWITLAKRIAKIYDLPYLHILIPEIKNKRDPNNYAMLTHELRPELCILGENNILYTLKGIADLEKKPNILYTFLPSEQYPKKTMHKPRAFSIREMARIKEKEKAKSPLPFTIISRVHWLFWDYIKEDCLPTWSRKGEIPRRAAFLLLELVRAYYAIRPADRSKLFLEQFRQVSMELDDLEYEDVNCLYGQEILIDSKKYYLIDILIECLKPVPHIEEQYILALAEWLCMYDASLVLRDCVHLNELYRKLQRGAYFTPLHLKNYLLVNARKDGASDETRVELLSLRRALCQNKLIERPVFDQELTSKLKELFSNRWSWILDNKRLLSYTRCQSGVNAEWINIAQLLSGAGVFSVNYYRELMPTIDQHIDLVRRYPITHLSLSHCILSEDTYRPELSGGRVLTHSLIPLENSLTHLRVHGTFANCSTSPPQLLEPVEIEELSYAAKRYRRYRKVAEERVANKPLSRAIILALYELLNKSIIVRGIHDFEGYTTKELPRAERAYITFYGFLESLPPIERKNFLSYRVLRDSKYSTISSILGAIRGGGCASSLGLDLVKVVADHVPWIFAFEAEAKVVMNTSKAPLEKRKANSVFYTVQSFRRYSAGAVCSDYHWLSSEIAMTRLQAIYSSFDELKIKKTSASAVLRPFFDWFFEQRDRISIENARHKYCWAMELAEQVMNDPSVITAISKINFFSGASLRKESDCLRRLVDGSFFKSSEDLVTAAASYKVKA